MININNALIEVTRRCNLACEHCLRGNAQNKNISDETLDMFFSKIDGGYIGDLTLTGGEPSLVPDRINAVVNFAKKHNVSIGNFYIVTNGQKVSDEFLLSVVRLYAYCNDNECSGLYYSDDDYHDGITYENKKRLEMFKFTHPRGESGLYDYEIMEGRAKENGIGVREEKGINPEFFDMENYIFDDTISSEMELYLNCKGNIVCGCDWSYKSQDKAANKICHVNDFSIEVVRAYLAQFEKISKAA